MPEYFEVHISRKNLERLIYISIIFVLLIIALISLNLDKKECPEIVCEEKPKETKKVEEKPIEPLKEEAPTVYYVDMANFNFAPEKLIIKKDSKLIFRNKEITLVHKLYELKGLFFSPRIEPLDKFEYIFNQTGNFTILSIMGKDKGMKMEIVVIEKIE
jgi:plastocyanin